MSHKKLILRERVVSRTLFALAVVCALGFAGAGRVVAQEVVAIAAGGPAQSNASGGDYSFVADEDFSGGGDNSVSSATINLTQPGANAAPMAVYQHARAGVFTYTIPGLTAGSQYTVLLHFAETYFSAKGGREFNVAINSTTVLTNLDIYNTVGKNAALLETFTATANSGGDIVIAFTTGAANQPVVSGLEIRRTSTSCSAVPAAPTGLTATASSSSAINLTWNADTPPANCTITSYSIYRSTTSGFAPGSGNVIASGVTGTTYSDTGLSASTTYYFVVEAVDSDGTSAASTQQSAETQAPTTGTEIVAIAAGGPAESNSGGGDFSFVADEDFTGGGDNSAVTATINLTQPGANAAPMAVYQHGRSGVFTYTIPGLTAGSSYSVLLHFAETYFSAAGGREFNVAINGTSVLTNLDIYATVGKDAALLETFTATANSSGQIVIAFTAGAANQPLLMGLEIRSGSGSSCSAVPSAPTGLTATASSSSAIGLSWSAVTPPANCTISSYTVYGGTTANPTTVIASGVTGTTYSNTGLAASTTYYYVVKAVDADGTSAASTQASTETLVTPCSAVPSAPTGLTATAASSSAINLSWSADTPPANCTISSYTIYGGTTANPTTVIASAVTGTTYANTGLAASTTYYYVVKAVDADGTSTASTQASTQTLASGSTEIVAIAAGGPAESNSGGGDYSFVADEDFSGGGDNAVSSATINLTQPGTNAAPMAVYQHARAGVFTYTIPGLAAGSSYSVLLHFAETYFTAKGDREFNVAINGTTVLTNLDIYNTVGKNAALLETFTATANSSGQIVIVFTTGAADQPLVSGIEIR
jgi:fibronectin type 3 domain-containing protein